MTKREQYDDTEWMAGWLADMNKTPAQIAAQLKARKEAEEASYQAYLKKTGKTSII